MENFNFYAPTYFAFGKDRENDAGQLVKRFGGSKVLVHFGGGSVIRSGLLDRVKNPLKRKPFLMLNLAVYSQISEAFFYIISNFLSISDISLEIVSINSFFML